MLKKHKYLYMYLWFNDYDKAIETNSNGSKMQLSF